MLEMIVQRTNEEIDRREEGNVENRPSFCKNVDIVELKAFIGLLYFAGLEKNNHTNLEDLWSPEFGYNLYRAVMTERRFQYLLQNFRFDDKNTRDARIEEHALAHIKELWDALIANCKRYYSPSTNCTIDDQLLGFRGRFGARVYIANKPDKYGIKIVTCNDVQTPYLIDAEPYVGKVETARGESVPSYYIKKLTEHIHNSGRNVTCDSWFMSIKIVQEMKDNYSLTMVGTLRKNKPKIPGTFTQSAAAGTVRFAYADGMTLLSYCPKRNKVVLLLSSLHKAGRMDEKIGKPEIVGFHNATKGGIDTFDELCKNYTTNRTTKRWPMRLFFGMLDRAGVNSAVLYNLREANPTLARHTFLKELVHGLIKPCLEQRL
ncbi:piggyBac transposable element-derived protein 4-like isoform X1 [Neodiprion pinetum]|uniref:piggyBac transposable element-derived protein 4-like isoform X1 n=1 Tax=Neodiprion pinetum TaxID=441929 RepID=UPI001EDEC6B4|nr:piggyBac transposable element-derived protein 4-like [Neodiprion pinetum]